VFETQILRLEVSGATEIPEAQTKADQLLWALSKRLEAVLAERGAEQVSSLRERLARAREAYGQVHERLSKLQELQQRLYVDTWQADLSREGMLAEYRSLQKERVDLEAKLAAMNARQSALEEQVARIGREAARLAGEDPVALELEKVVKLREQKLERMKELVAAGKVTAAEAADVEEGVAQARAELAKQRQVASQAAGGALLGDLNKEVVSLMVNIAEAKARHEFVNQALDRYQIPELQDRADRYDREVAGELPGVRDAAERALAEQTRAGEELSSYRPPAVVVLGAASDETGTPASK
jgi:chromosome segregation ATPase